MQHPNARLSVYQRHLIVERVKCGWTVVRAARAAGVSRQTASKWVNRWRRLGAESMCDASSRPHHTRPRVSQAIIKRIIKARLRFRRGPHFLGWQLGLAGSTVHVVLRRLGLNRLSRRPKEEVRRYEWPEPGDLVHLDIKKLGRIGQGGGKRFGKNRSPRGLGWEHVHVAIDDHSRIAYAEICPDEAAATTVAFTRRAIEFFAAAGIEVRRILTDNGSAYRSGVFADLLADHDISMRKTRPYRPQTNGKAEAFVKIVANEWAYVRPYQNNEERAERLGPFLKYYNLYRPHGGIGGQRPISRVHV
ncbi:MAG: IS481 family transposase [Actinobacteria bacterium]|nr:IS481 family transposase [Actinomycetota bacterium]